MGNRTVRVILVLRPMDADALHALMQQLASVAANGRAEASARVRQDSVEPSTGGETCARE